MYTKTATELKNDFYRRFGAIPGRLAFEHVGLPCTLMRSDAHSLSIALSCGIFAYGIQYGDITKTVDAASNICSVHPAQDGKGVQILYKSELPGLKSSCEAEIYTTRKLISKLLGKSDPAIAHLSTARTDMYGKNGFLAYTVHNATQAIALSLSGFNILLLHAPAKHTHKAEPELESIFYAGESARIKQVCAAKTAYRTEALFSMMNESFFAAKKLLYLPHLSDIGADAALNANGVRAVRITADGVIFITECGMTDTAAYSVKNEFERLSGTAAKISVLM